MGAVRGEDASCLEYSMVVEREDVEESDDEMTLDGGSFFLVMVSRSSIERCSIPFKVL